MAASSSAGAGGRWVSDEEDERRRALYERLLETCEKQEARIAELTAQVAALSKGKGGKAAEGRWGVAGGGKGAPQFIPFTPGDKGGGKTKEERWYLQQETRYAAMQQKAASKAAGKGKDGEGKAAQILFGGLPRDRSRSPPPAWVRNLPQSPQTPQTPPGDPAPIPAPEGYVWGSGPFIPAQYGPWQRPEYALELQT